MLGNERLMTSGDEHMQHVQQSDRISLLRWPECRSLWLKRIPWLHVALMYHDDTLSGCGAHRSVLVVAMDSWYASVQLEEPEAASTRCSMALQVLMCMLIQCGSWILKGAYALTVWVILNGVYLVEATRHSTASL